MGPEVGEDAALIDIGDKYLVAKTDPITFTTKDIGWYAVQVNTNDIAVMGATAKWMLATILLPESVEEEAIRNIFQGFFAGKVSCRWVGLQTELARSITPYSMAMHTLQRLRLFQI